MVLAFVSVEGAEEYKNDLFISLFFPLSVAKAAVFFGPETLACLK